MTCHDEFPVSTVVYNWVTAAGVMALGVAVAGQFGIGAVVAYALLLVIALVGKSKVCCGEMSGACSFVRSRSSRKG